MQVLMPKLGFSMEEGVVAEWLQEDGIVVLAGQPLYSLESEKSVQEIEAPSTGRLRIIAAQGQTYKVGEVLAEIIERG
jgi:pyruvate/2-oxoglutarate dehydrogenase complex dihydrolipoamide acyltransferase (E2) component